jgi:hypothetical protein
LKAAQASGMSLAGYAAQHGINVRRLYETRHARARAKTAQARKASAFVRITHNCVSPRGIVAEVPQRRAIATLAMQARLGNGVVLSWTHDASSGQTVAELMHTLAALPCFA